MEIATHLRRQIKNLLDTPLATATIVLAAISLVALLPLPG